MSESEKKKKEPTVKKAKPRRIAMYVIYDKNGLLDKYRVYYLQELRKVTDTIIAVVSGTLTPESRVELEGLTDGILVRENKGLLAGSWVDGIRHIGWDKLDRYDELLMLNDSFFGPFYPLSEMFDTMEQSDADFYGCHKNYEEPSITEWPGNKLKHGHLRGSICYFYVIRKRLLHSPEFKRYWGEMPEVRDDWDTYFFAEINFFDYVKDCGFKVDAYQSDKLKGYMHNTLSHSMEKLIRDDRIPFARIRSFGSVVLDQALQTQYGKDPRRTLEYIENNTDYDTNMIWDFLLRTKNLTDIWTQLQLEYVVPKHSVEKPFTYDKRIAVILHIYYTDLVERMADYCTNLGFCADFYVTCIHEETEEKINEEFKKRGLTFQCQRRRNVGVAMSTLWITYADVVLDGKYEYICYFHDKKSPYSVHRVQGEQFGVRCYENLFGTPEVVKNIINLFEDSPRLGVLGVPMPYHGAYFSVSFRNWGGLNYDNTVKLAKTLGLNVNIDPHKMPVAPYGDMMWFRADAMKKAIGHRFDYDDFAIDYKPDGTILHAIERIYSFAAQDSGYYYADVINSDDARSDLVNYQYMLYSLCEILLARGQYPANYDWMRAIVAGQTPPQVSGRVAVKRAIKKRIPKPIWKASKKIYHFFGGKKWVG